MMGILSHMGQERRAAWQAAGLHDPVLAQWFGADAQTQSGVSVSGDDALRVASVYACVRLLARTLATIPLHLYRRRGEDRERANNEPLAPLLREKPNRWQTSFEFREMLMGHLALRGKAFARIVEPGAPRGLVPMHPDRVRPFFAPDGNLAFDYTPPSPDRQVVLLDHEVLYLRGMSTDILCPLSPITLHRETFGENIAAQQYNARLFRNNAQPKGAVVVPSKLDRDQSKRLLEAWMARHGGDNQNLPAVLHSGMDWKQIGMSNQDAEFILNRKFTTREIARIFGIPPHKIGDLEQATFSNIEHQAIEFVTDSIEPWTRCWEQRLMLTLMSDSYRRSRFLEFDLNGLLRGDSEARSTLYRELWMIGAITQNEIRRRENMNGIAGGDTTYVPLNMAPADKVLEILLKDKGSEQQARLMELMREMAAPDIGQFLTARKNANGALKNGH